MYSLIVLFLFYSAIATAQPDQGFSWVHPRPTGDLLWDVAWVGENVFVACGQNGTLYRTSDAGATWSIQQAEMLAPLRSMAYDDGLLVAGGQNGRAYLSTDQGLTWDPDRIPSLNMTLREIHIFDRNHIVAVCSNLSAGGVVIITEDGGVTWDFIDPGVLTAFRGLDFLDDRVGWAVGTGGYLLRTEDAGRSWEPENSHPFGGRELQTVRFRSLDTGIVAGDLGRVFVTHDGGETWNLSQLRSNATFYDAVWVDDTTVVVTGEYEQARSSDAGLTWRILYLNGRFFGLGFSPSGLEGMTVGLDGGMRYTSDGGVSWRNLTTSVPAMDIKDLAVSPTGDMVAVGVKNGVMLSRDAGASWIRSFAALSTPGEDITGVAYPSAGHVVAISPSGDVIHSSDGGEKWKIVVREVSPYLREISFSDSVHGWIAGKGLLLRTTDGGLSWTIDDESVQYPLWAVHAVSYDVAYATGDSGRLFRTSDAGANWVEIENDFTVRFSMVRADKEGNITLGWPGGVVHSTDGGLTWEDNRSPDGTNLQHFSFLTPSIGWGGQHNNPVMSTTDAGVTWRELEHGLRETGTSNAGMMIVELVAPGIGYVAGSSAFILEYRDPDVSGVVEGKVAGDQDGVTVRHVDGHLVVAGATGKSDILVYDILGRLLHRVHAADITGGYARVDIDAVGTGYVLVIEEDSGRVGRWVGVE